MVSQGKRGWSYYVFDLILPPQYGCRIPSVKQAHEQRMIFISHDKMKNPHAMTPAEGFSNKRTSEPPEEVDRDAILDQPIVLRSQRHFVGESEIEPFGNARAETDGCGD